MDVADRIVLTPKLTHFRVLLVHTRVPQLRQFVQHVILDITVQRAAQAKLRLVVCVTRASTAQTDSRYVKYRPVLVYSRQR